MSEPDDQILNLWPTLFGRARCDGHERHGERLRALAELPDTPEDLLEVDDDSVRWLRSRIEGAVQAWFEAADSVRPAGVRTSAWFDRIGFCDYRELGNEPGAYLAGVYFIDKPDPPELDHVRRDLRPSLLSLFDPRVGFNSISVEGDPYFAPVVRVDAEPGALALWPGYLRSHVSVHLARRSWAMVRFRVDVVPTDGDAAPAPVETEALRMSQAFPTKLVCRRLPDAAGPTRALKELILAEERRRENLTARYQEQDFFRRTEPAVRWLEAHINDTVAAYLQHVGVKLRIEWTPVEGWFNVNRLGDQHAPHAHQACYLSGTYYVEVPTEPDPALAVREHAHPACISFYDPRSAANMLALGTEPDSRATHVVRPRAGMLMMWPSALQHYVHPNLSHQDRISISFNIILRKVAGVVQ